MARLIRAATDRNPPTLGGGGCQVLIILYKAVECRTWKTSYRGPLLICSSRGNCVDTNEYGDFIFYGGLALGVVKLADIRKMTRKDLKHAYIPAEWHKDALKRYAWHVKKLYELVPFPVKGRLNLFEVDDALLVRLPEE